MIRLLIVDDSPTVRTLLRSIFEAAEGIEVVGEARDGKEAVALAEELRPDLVTMDIHMPVMDGLEATREIMARCPTPIVIVSSTVKAQEVSVAFDALDAGALAVAEKPVDPHHEGFAAASADLVSTVRQLSGLKLVRRRPRRAEPQADFKRANGRIVGIAASTGGPAALHRILGELPRDFAAPILVVQHIGTGFTEGLAKWLGGSCRLSVEVARDGALACPGNVYVAPDGLHMGVGPGGHIALDGAPPVDGFRPSATHLFETLARHRGAHVLAVVLTGMGRDGLAGLHSVKRAGGRVVVQNRETSVVYGMNAEAERSGLANAVLPVHDIAAHLKLEVGVIS